MIKNERQYTITKKQAERFEQTIRDLDRQGVPAGTHPLLARAERDSLQSQLQDLKDELAEYEALRSGAKPVDVRSLEDLPKALISGRIAAGLSQRELAERLGVAPQQVQRDPSPDSALDSASQATLNGQTGTEGHGAHATGQPGVGPSLPHREVAPGRAPSRPVAAGLVLALPRDPWAARIGALVESDPEAAAALVTSGARLRLVQEALEEHGHIAPRAQEQA